jgi:hypothetical protein
MNTVHLHIAPARRPLRVVAYGGGVQSTALLVLAAQQRLDIGTFLFANVGDDSEHPRTLQYVRAVAAPYAARHGIALHELHRYRRDGSVETLYGRLTRPQSRSLPIPVRMSNGAPGTRSCTADFKIVVMGRWLKAHGATATNPAVVAVGISLDEWHRAHNRRSHPYETVTYPLLDRRLDRSACTRIIRDAGLPVPGKSACFFCPFTRPGTFAQMRRDDPDLFARACGLEDLLNARRRALGRDPVWLTRFNAPLADAVAAAQDPLPGLDVTDDATCDNGACFT